MSVRHSNANLAVLLSEEKPYRPSILAAILARLGDDLTTEEAALVAGLESTPFLLRRMTIPDIVNMAGTDETVFASIFLPAGIVRSDDAVRVQFSGAMNSTDGSAEFTFRVYPGNDTGETPIVTFTHTPATTDMFTIDAVLHPVAGTPLGGDGPDTGLGFGRLIVGGSAPNFQNYAPPIGMDLAQPVMVRITCQVDLGDGSNVEGFDWNITNQHASKHAAALE